MDLFLFRCYTEIWNLIQSVYKRGLNVKTKLLNKLFPIILFIYPLIGVNRGISYTDETCCVVNYMNLDALSDFWRYGYYYANMLGNFLTKLPFGENLLALKIYSALFVSIIAVVGYFFCKKIVTPYVAFFASVISISLCWCPTLILYNYMTYFFFMAAVILLYKGVIGNSKMQIILAGVILAQNVFVRFPNVLEVALIAAVWYYMYLKGKKIKEILAVTGFCVLGYVTGLGIGFVVILITGGSILSFINMIGDVFVLSENSSGYSLVDMIRAIFEGYKTPYKFELVMLLAAFLGGAVFWIVGKKEDKAKDKKYNINRLILFGKILFIPVATAMFVWFYFRGIMAFNYNSYDSIYKLSQILLLICWIVIIKVFICKKNSKEEKYYAALCAVIMIITPLGSNNGTYPIMNNLFIILPLVVKECREFVINNKKTIYYPAKVILALFTFIFLYQGMMFKTTFTFNDYDEKNSPRNVAVQDIPKLDGMKTREDNTKELEGLYKFIQSVSEEEDGIITYGNVPGLHYILDRNIVTPDIWIDLVTNSYDILKDDLSRISDEAKKPFVIVGKGYDITTMTGDKEKLITKYLYDNAYNMVYKSDVFTVYGAKVNGK